MAALLELLKLLIQHAIEAPIRVLQAFIRAFPNTDHYRFNVIVDVLAAVTFVIFARQIPPDHKTAMVFVCLAGLLGFFVWCFKTSIHR